MTQERAPVAIVGAGFAGLVAARELHRRAIPFVVFEAGPEVAGLARSFRDDEGFTHDVGAHFITNRLATEIGVAGACRLVRRYGEAVLLGGHVHRYPYGLMRSPRFLVSALKSRLGRSRHTPPTSAAEWFRAAYGRALADQVAIPLVEAWSGVPATELSPAVGVKLRSGVLQTAWLKAASHLTGRAVASGYCGEMPESAAVWHVYPEGGVSTLCEHLAAQFPNDIRLESPVDAILVEGGRAAAVCVRGKRHDVSAVISTAPVNVLARLVHGTRALEPLRRFRYRPMTFVNMRFAGRDLLPDVVTWTPDAGLPFFRVTEAPRSMPWLAPEGKTMLTVDIGCEVGDDIWTMSPATLGELCLAHLAPIIGAAERGYMGCHVVRTPIAYPVMLAAYEEDRARFADSSGVDGLLSIGRNGEFAHILMEDVYWRTLRKMDALGRSLSSPSSPSPSAVAAG